MTQEFVTLPRDVVEQALKAFEHIDSPYWHDFVEPHITALRAALEQPQDEQKPDAWLHSEGKAQPLYLHPQRKPLTDEQIAACFPVQWEGEFYKQWRKEVACNIERAHGIGHAK